MFELVALDNIRWRWRLPMKWAIFALTCLTVCFPYPGRLVRHIRHWTDPNALIQPDAPALQPLVEELRPRLSGPLTPKEALRRVEHFVYERIPYEWDWNTWGTADYLPTVTEAIVMGKEDCDGRAVIAASLLRNFGFEAQLVADFTHMWVKTDRGETMAPGKRKAIVAMEDGLHFDPSALADLPKALALGVAVFPLARELIILGVLWWLLLRRVGVGSSLGSLGLFLFGLFLLRAVGKPYLDTPSWLTWLGLAGLTAGFVPPFVVARYNIRSAVHAEAGGTPRESHEWRDTPM